MFATGFWSPLAAPLVNGVALLLALGFHRNRAVLMLVTLALASLAISGVLSGEQGARMRPACSRRGCC